MSAHRPEHDPRSRFEDEGIPDLQEGTPEQQWAEDPQEAPLPGDEPVALDEYGTTVREQIEREPLSRRLDREEPEEQAELETARDDYAEGRWPGEDGYESRRANRLVAPNLGGLQDNEPDEVAEEVGPDGGGYSAEEAAMRVEPE